MRYREPVTERVDFQRRRILLVIAGAPVAGTVLAGCTASPGGKLAARHPGPVTDARVRWSAVRSEQVLLALYAATAERHAGLADALEPLTAHHREHVAALLSDGSLPLLARAVLGLPAQDSGASVAAEVDLSAVKTPEVPGEADAALQVVREAERAASQAHLADCMQAAGTRLAALLASIAAAEAAHDAQLERT